MRASTDGTQRAEIYRQVAKYMEDGKCEYVCWSLENHGLSCEPMRDLFCGEPADRQWGDVWMSCDGDDSYPHGDNRQEQLDRRVLALCFMAAMVEAGDA